MSLLSNLRIRKLLTHVVFVLELSKYIFIPLKPLHRTIQLNFIQIKRIHFSTLSSIPYMFKFPPSNTSRKFQAKCSMIMQIPWSK